MTRNAGTITLGSKVTVSDPCYNLGTWCQGVLENVLPGEYNCSYNFDENEGRVSYMYVSHNSLDEKTVRNIVAYTEAEDFEVGVDSGMAGIYDYDYYAAHHKDDLDKEWYTKVYEATKVITPNQDFGKFLTEDWFLQLIDDYIKEMTGIIKPEDEVDLYYTMSCIAKTIMHYVPQTKTEQVQARKENEYCKEFDKILKEKLQAVNLDKGNKQSIVAERKFQSVINRAEFTIPYKQRYSESINYNAMAVDDKAFVSPSGFGDGGYICNTHKNEDNMIDFIEIFFYDEI